MLAAVTIAPGSYSWSRDARHAWSLVEIAVLVAGVTARDRGAKRKVVLAAMIVLCAKSAVAAVGAAHEMESNATESDPPVAGGREQ